MSGITYYKKVLKGMTKAQQKKWDDLQGEIKDRNATLIIREAVSGFLIMELFSSEGKLVYENRLDDPMPGPGNIYLRNLISYLGKYFEETVHVGF